MNGFGIFWVDGSGMGQSGIFGVYGSGTDGSASL